MARGLPPTTHAVSYMDIFYGNAANPHQSRFWFNDTLTGAAIAARANAIIAVMKALVTSDYNFTGYAYAMFGDSLPVPTPLSPVVPGTAPGIGSSPGSNSFTLTFSGIGTNPNPGEAKGKARIVVAPGINFGGAPGVKEVAYGANAYIDAFINLLNDPSIGVMNIYGQSASFYPRATVQFNARLQRKRGS